MKWKPGSPCSNATYEFLAPQFVLHYLGWKIEVVGWRNPKMQENARVGGSRCRSQRVGQKGKISKWELKKIVQQQLGYAFKQMKHCNKKIHQKCFSEMCNCTERMDKVRSILQQCNGIRTGHISPTVMSVTPLPLSCLVTWHVELFCGSLQWGGVWMMLLFLAFHFVAVIGGSLIGFNGFHFFL
jgi:hypothetical protein